MLTLTLLWLFSASLAAAQFPACTQANTSFCETPVSGVTQNNIIFRCYYDQGEATPGNCNDDLVDVPPVGLKYAYCWESSPTAGDAQCTYNCVSVTAANGTTFYPVGCDRLDSSTTTTQGSSAALSTSSLSSFAQGGSHSTTSASQSSSSASSTIATTTSKSKSESMLIGGSAGSVWCMLAMVGAYFIV